MSSVSGSAGSTLARESAHALSYDSPASLAQESYLSSGPSDVDSDGFLQSSHRAGGPYLCSLPARFQAVRTGYPDRAGLERDTEAILNREGISFQSVNVTGRRSKIDTEPEPVPTVVVVTEQASRRVAKEIRRAVVPFIPKICVELIAEALLEPCYSFASNGPTRSSTSGMMCAKQFCPNVTSLNGRRWSAGDAD